MEFWRKRVRLQSAIRSLSQESKDGVTSMKTSSHIYLGAAILVAAACGGDLVVPSPDNAAEFAFTSPVSYVCGGWHPARPDVQYGLFDVWWGSPRAETPTAELLKAVQSAGGVLVYEFHINQVRAIIAPDEVPGLGAWNTTGFWSATGVVDPNQLSVDVIVVFLGTADPSVVTALGGTVTHTYTHVPAVAAMVPDDILPTLRAQPRVTYVEANGVGCLADS